MGRSIYSVDSGGRAVSLLSIIVVRSFVDAEDYQCHNTISVWCSELR